MENLNIDSMEKTIQQDFKVEGMTCAVCAGKVEKTLNRLSNVSSAQVNLATERATIVFKEDKDAIRIFQSEIKKAGYGLFPISENHSKANISEDQNNKLKKQKFDLIIAGIFSSLLFLVAMGHMAGLPVPNFLNPVQSPKFFSSLQLILLIPVIICGRNFYSHGFKALYFRSPNMDSLIAIGTSAATLYSIWSTVHVFQGDSDYAFHLYYETAAMILALVMLGKYLEARSKGKTSSAIEKLIQLRPKTAIIITSKGIEKSVPLEEICIGSTIIAKPGERIAVDGKVVSGNTYIDESMLTGESIPVHKKNGDSVTAGSLNQNGYIRYLAEKVGEETALARIIRLVETAQGNKAPIARVADIISGYFVPVVIGIAAFSALTWLLTGADLVFSLKIFIAVLVIACPCALGLATPTAIMVGTGRGASLGILIKGGEPLETAGRVSTVIFDKTGTITRGKPTVTNIIPQKEFSVHQLLQWAVTAEQFSEHPIATAILEKAASENIKLLEGENFKAIPGHGIHLSISDQSVWVGNFKLMQMQNILKHESEHFNTLYKEAKTPVFIAVNGKFAGLIAIMDPIKDNSKTAIARLKQMGIHTVMLTGDNYHTAEAIANCIEIDEFVAQVLPEEKATHIAKFQSNKQKVAMVGDGINDAPALAQSDLGIAIGSGTDIAIESAQVVLMKNTLMDVVNAIQLSRATLTNIKQNLFWALFYNSIGIPVAAGVLFALGGPTLNPMFGAAAMAFSSISVVTNALRLKRFQPVSDTSAHHTDQEDSDSFNSNISQPSNQKTKMNTDIIIEGMMCQHCVKHATEALQSISSVTNVTIDLKAGTAHVTSTATLSGEEIHTVITEAGYKVIEIKK